MCSGKAKAHWNEKASNGVRYPAGLVHTHSDKTGSAMKHRAFLMYPLHAALLHCNVKL